MKYFYLLTFFFASVVICNAQDSPDKPSGMKSPERRNPTGNLINALSSTATERNIARLDEGYTAFQGGEYIIKDYIVNGALSLIEVVHGTSIAADYQLDRQKFRRKPEKSYYIQRGEDKTAYRQVFLAPSRKKSLLEMSKGVLLDLFKEDKELMEQVKALQEVDRAELKKLVKLYNKKQKGA